MNFFSRNRKGNYKAHNYSLLFCIHMLNEYERKYSKNKLELYLSECPVLKSKEYDKKYFEDLQDQKNLFLLWLLYVTVARRNNLLAEMLRVTNPDDIDKYYYLKNKERWILNFEEYFKYIAKVALDQLALYDYKKLQEQYQALIQYWASFLDHQILYLKNWHDSLIKIIAFQSEIILLIKAQVINETIALYESLPPMNPEGERLRESVIAEMEEFRNNDERPLNDLLEFRLESINKVIKILQEDGYSPEVISQIENKHTEQDNNLKYGIVLEDSNKFLEENVAKLAHIIKKSEEGLAGVVAEGRAPSYNLKSLTAIAEDNKKTMAEQAKLIKDIDSTCIAAAEPNQILIATTKEISPQLAEKMDILSEMQKKIADQQDDLETYGLLNENEDENNDLTSTFGLNNNP